MGSTALPISFDILKRLNLSYQSAVILLAIFTALIFSSFDLFQDWFVGNEVNHSSLENATVPVLTTPSIQEAPNSLNAPQSAAPPAPIVQISVCNGGSTANFRRSPTLDDAVAFGVLQAGDLVQLTGRIAQSEGVNWVEAIAPERYPNQVGWVAACFVP